MTGWDFWIPLLCGMVLFAVLWLLWRFWCWADKLSDKVKDHEFAIDSLRESNGTMHNRYWELHHRLNTVEAVSK